MYTSHRNPLFCFPPGRSFCLLSLADMLNIHRAAHPMATFIAHDMLGTHARPSSQAPRYSIHSINSKVANMCL